MQRNGSIRYGTPANVAGAALLGALILAGQLAGAGAGTGGDVVQTAPLAALYALAGMLVLAGEPGHPVGRLLLAAGASAGVAAAGLSWSSWAPAGWLGQWTWWPPLGLVTLALLVFPDGRLPSRRWRPVVVAVAVATAGTAVALAVAAVDHPRSLLTSVIEFTPRAQLWIRIGFGFGVVGLAGLVAAVISLWPRWRRADAITRRQLACLLPAAVLLPVAVALELASLSGAWLLSALAVPVGMTVAVLRYRLYGLDRVINRGVVWLLMSVLVVAGFLVLVELLREAVTGGSASVASLVATGVIVLTFDPVRRRVQRGVDRLVYGERDDPYRVITRLGDLLSRTAEPYALLPRVVGTVAGSLQVPYVSIEQGDGRLLAEYGTPVGEVEAFDLVSRDEVLGRLLVAPRTAGGRFGRAERRLLADVALQAAVAVESTRLVRDLRDSRERLVLAREEERRRLRRDLHDGVGPALSGMAMQVRAARKLVAGQAQADTLLDTLADDLNGCVTEVRRLVDRLRPPILDSGLAAALHIECRRFVNAPPTVQLELIGDLEGLPAAVEVAAYRIVGEALTNVARHSGARICVVTVSRQRSLVLEVVDDGVGIRTPAGAGVGLSSMRERAAELGGDCLIGPADPRGTAVRVRLPITAAQPGESTAQPALVAGL
jgi:two-component system NarL family sensor kinase